MAYRGRSDNRLLVVDIGGHTVGVYYRSPTASEYQGYHTEKVTLDGRRVRQTMTAANIKYGLKVITGIRPGDLEYREATNGDPRWMPLDTEALPEAIWKDILRRDFFELVDFVGAKVFNPVDELTASSPEEASDEEDYTAKNS